MERSNIKLFSARNDQFPHNKPCLQSGPGWLKFSSLKLLDGLRAFLQSATNFYPILSASTGRIRQLIRAIVQNSLAAFEGALWPAAGRSGRGTRAGTQ